MTLQAFRLLLYGVLEAATGLAWSIVWSTPLHEPALAWVFFVAMLLSLLGKIDAAMKHDAGCDEKKELPNATRKTATG